jgi:hypothetical protein
VLIDKTEPDFVLDNKHLIVQYKTDFFGWYYPVDDTTSDSIYYYVDDMGPKYRVVTNFKDINSGDIKIHAFPGASEGVINWDALKGGLARSWISLQIGVKKVIIDLFSDPVPDFE